MSLPVRSILRLKNRPSKSPSHPTIPSFPSPSFSSCLELSSVKDMVAVHPCHQRTRYGFYASLHCISLSPSNLGSAAHMSTARCFITLRTIWPYSKPLKASVSGAGIESRRTPVMQSRSCSHFTVALFGHSDQPKRTRCVPRTPDTLLFDGSLTGCTANSLRAFHPSSDHRSHGISSTNSDTVSLTPK